MGINVIGVTHPRQVGALPGGTNVLVLADDGTCADEFLDTDFRAHQLVVRAHGHGSAFFGVADIARELGASRVLFGGFRDVPQMNVTAEEDPVLVLGDVIAFNSSFAQRMHDWIRPASAYGDGLVTWLTENAAKAGLRVLRPQPTWNPLRTDAVPMRRKLTA
ncbi:hypothetical protein [Lentzea kentuckyensis]|uniref:hypothetical protein n=1 Tax=Lentzea kentuckyensis TaxID=360086 RepID=UPI00117AEA75|nr:hypothetical protein [Lentzea kentuckyensis]